MAHLDDKILHFDGKRSPGRLAAIADGWIEVLLKNGEIHKMNPYRKHHLTWATQIPVDFEVDTIEGMHSAHSGDYLAVGQAGELYPVAQDIFNNTYEEVKDGE